jgi:hypothetical protein
MNALDSSYEGTVEIGKLKAWFDDLLNIIQSTANEQGAATTIKLTIAITATPDQKEPEQK